MLLASLWPGAARAATGQPTLNIFPTQLIDDIKETGDSATELESGLHGVIDELDRQKSLYEAGRCEGARNDSGCAKISQQIAKTYSKMLDVLADKLPEIQQRINVTHDILEKRLAVELGRNRTGKELQQLLRKTTQGALAAQRTRIRRPGVRLSDRFRSYFRLVSQTSEGSLALTGADMYLDLEETTELIALTRQSLDHSRLISSLSASLGTLSPESERTVAGIKRIVFGEFDEAGKGETVPAKLNGGSQKTDFCSEFDTHC